MSSPSPQDAAPHLVDLACQSIERGLGEAWSPAPPCAARTPALDVRAACFVTLSSAAHGLRGCCGTLEAHRSLVADVWHNAHASAFDDPRFLPLERDEFDDLVVEISVLSAPRPLAVASQEALLANLVPHRDGVVIGFRGRRATFLPKVWQHVSDPRQFVAELKAKAGLARGFWSSDVAIWTYRTECIAGTVQDYRERLDASHPRDTGVSDRAVSTSEGPSIF